MEIPVHKLDQEEILRYLGAKQITEIPETLQQTLKLCTRLTLETARPLGTYRHFPIHRTKDGIAVGDTGLILSGSSIESHLHEAESIWLMAVTIGQKMDTLIRTKMLQKTEEGVILDSCGAAAVEEAADALEAVIREQTAAENRYLTPRFSPGYGDLPIELQPKFLSVLNASRQIGLMTTSSCLLTPSKSVTAVLGVIPEPFIRELNPCDACKLRQICTLRKAGTPCWETKKESSC